MRRMVATLAVLLAAPALAGPTLAELLASADRANVDGRISAEQRTKAAADFRQAWTAMLPYLSASGTWTHNQYPASFNSPAGTVTIVPADQLDAVLRLDLPLVDTGRWYRAMAASNAEGSAVERERQARDGVRRAVAQAYFGYGAALALRASSRRSAEVAEAQVKLQEIRSTAGAATQLDLLRARAEAQRTRQVIADAESLVATSRRTLQTLTGLDPGDEVALPDADTRSEGTLEELEGGLEALPALRAAAKDQEAAAKLATATKLALVPLVGAQFTQRFTNATGFAGQAASYNFGLNLGWRLDAPAFMGMQSADASARVSALAVERARLQAKDQLFSDWQRLRAATEKVGAAEAQMQATQRAAEVAKDRYAVGAATQLDVIQAERDYFSAEVGHIQARAELASAHVAVRLSAGRPPVD